MNKSVYTILLFLICPFILFSQVEICDNGIDDDNDGLVDLNDDDCYCEIIEPISLIPNPSFEDMNCCPNERSQLDCASDWIQASEPTTDYIHLCDWLGWDEFPPPMPFPDGEGIMGFRDGRVRNNGNNEYNWKEYAGACLINPLLKDSTYLIKFDVGFVNTLRSPPIDITFFGTTNCDYLPFGVGNEDFGCPSNDPNWKELAQINVSGNGGNVWVNSYLEIVPDEDIYAIAIGPDCNPVSTSVSLYYFFDNLLLADFKSFNLEVSEIGHPCSSDFALSVPDNPDFQYQWYLFGVALVGETASTLSQTYGEGDYQVRIIDGTSCRSSVAFEYRIPIISEPVQRAICLGDALDFGDLQLTTQGTYTDTFPSYQNCDSIVTLELDVIGEKYDTVEVSILEGESVEIGGQTFKNPGDYDLNFTSSLGCDSLVLLTVNQFNIYIPNTFSPNGDGINNLFHPFFPLDEIQSLNMQIFDRWGNLIYEGEEWDGTDASPDVYVYSVIFQFTNNTSKTFSGDVTLVR